MLGHICDERTKVVKGRLDGSSRQQAVGNGKRASGEVGQQAMGVSVPRQQQQVVEQVVNLQKVATPFVTPCIDKSEWTHVSYRKKSGAQVLRSEDRRGYDVGSINDEGAGIPLFHPSGMNCSS